MEMSGAWQTERACLFHSSYMIAERMDCEMAIKEWIKGDTKNRIKIPKHYKVVIYNDDFTPMDFVVKVLMQVFDKEEQEATAIMMSIHTGSSAVAGEYPRDIANTKAEEVMQMARQEGYPLKAEAVCAP